MSSKALAVIQDTYCQYFKIGYTPSVSSSGSVIVDARSIRVNGYDSDAQEPVTPSHSITSGNAIVDTN